MSDFGAVSKYETIEVSLSESENAQTNTFRTKPIFSSFLQLSRDPITQRFKGLIIHYCGIMHSAQQLGLAPLGPPS